MFITINDQGYPEYSGTTTQDTFSMFVEQVMRIDKELQSRDAGAAFDSLNNIIGSTLDAFYINNRATRLKLFASVIITDQVMRRVIDPADLVETYKLCKENIGLDSNDMRVCNEIAAYYQVWEGTPVRPFTGFRVDSTILRSAEFIGLMPFIIDFWASWCGPCIQEFPKLRELHALGKVDIIGISIDDRHQPWLTALNKLNLPWHNIRDRDREIRKLYNVSSVPTKFLVNKDGIIIVRNPEDIEAAIDAL
jgi:thiol-disulfide isomerase/thioredoxin